MQPQESASMEKLFDDDWFAGSRRLAHQGPRDQLHPPQLAQSDSEKLRRRIHHSYCQGWSLNRMNEGMKRRRIAGFQVRTGIVVLLDSRVHRVEREHGQLEDLQDQILQGIG